MDYVGLCYEVLLAQGGKIIVLVDFPKIDEYVN